MIICIVIGIIAMFAGIWMGINPRTKSLYEIFGGMCLTVCGIVLAFVCVSCMLIQTATYYLEAEPIAYNTDTTIFSTSNGYYTANAIYDEDTMYLLTMNGMGTTNTKDDEILVVWKCDEGSVG